MMMIGLQSSKRYCLSHIIQISGLLDYIQGNLKPEDFMQANPFRVEAILSNIFHTVSREGMCFVTMALQLLMIVRCCILARKKVGFSVTRN